MGGELGVTSTPGSGSTFTLSIPVSATTRKSAKANGASRPAAAETRSLKVLYAEDNPYGRVILNTILTEFGHRTDFAGVRRSRGGGGGGRRL